MTFARAAAERHNGPKRDELLTHLDFVERRLAALDPLGDIRAMVPTVREPEPEDLKPFLGRLSPYGPRHSG